MKSHPCALLVGEGACGVGLIQGRCLYTYSPGFGKPGPSTAPADRCRTSQECGICHF